MKKNKMGTKYVVVEQMGEDDFTIWFTDALLGEGAENTGYSVRGTYVEIVHEFEQALATQDELDDDWDCYDTLDELYDQDDIDGYYSNTRADNYGTYDIDSESDYN